MNEPAPRDELGREETIFNAAVQLGDAAKQAIYLDLACENDPALRARIEKLLGSDAGDNFFAQPLAKPVYPSAVAASPSAPAPSAPEAQALGERIGRYRLLEKIGEGGLGLVYMAEQEEPVRRRVALKVIRLGMDTQSVIARFEAERQALAMMDHPNIAKILDGGVTESGRPYFVMDLVQGLPITQFCDEAKLSTQARLELFREVCSAVQHAHQKGIIHRDLKPSNILVTLHGDKPVPKVIDFGIAKATQQRLTDKTLFTQFQQFMGTPAYVSPEQATLSGLDIDTRSDIYSLGVLLYELLTGKTPFDSKELLKAGLDEMRRTICEKEPPTPSTRVSTMHGDELTTTAQRRGIEPPKLVSTLRGDLDWIVMKCLEKDRARRYETANGLAMDIQRHLSHEPVVASPRSRFYRLRKLVRRNKLIFGAAALLLIVLMLGVLVSSWQAERAIRARLQANEETAKQNAINRFLNEMLASADPGRVSSPGAANGRNVTVVQVLADAARQLDNGSFQGRPAIEAAIRRTLGKTYVGLGHCELGEPHLLRALELNRRLHGEHSDEAAQSLLDLAILYGETTKPEKGRQLARETLAMEIKLHGKEHPHVVKALNVLATGVCSEAKSFNNPDCVTEAESTFHEALAIERRMADPDKLDMAQTLSGLAEVVMYWRQNLVEAESLLREALQLQKAMLGSKSVGVAQTLERLGYVLDCTQSYPEAEMDCEEAVSIVRELLGPKHFGLSVTLGTLGGMRLNQKRFSAAEAAFRESVAIRREAIPGGLDLAWSLKMLAQTLTAQQKFAEAAGLYREELEIREKVGGQAGVGSQSYWDELHALLRALKSQNDQAGIESAYRHALDRQRSIWGETHVVLPALLCEFSDFLKSCNRTGEAEKHYSEASDTITKLGAARNVPAVRSLARSLQSRGETEAAVELYKKLIQFEENLAEKPNTYLGTLRHEFGELLLWNLNEPDAAVEQYTKSLPARRINQNDDLAWTLRDLGYALVKSSRGKEAEPFLREALTLYWKLHRQDAPYETAVTRKHLAYALVQQSRLPEAEQAYRDAVTAFLNCRDITNSNFYDTVKSLVGLLESSGKPAETELVLDNVLEAVRKQDLTDHRVAETVKQLEHLRDVTVRSELSREWKRTLEGFEPLAGH
jgi:serine/threonine protein kinase/tetratricopeptide (TPR) repeat protein